MSATELRDAAEAAAWLAAGLALVRVGEGGGAALAAEWPLLAEIAAERGALPPPGVALDVARLFAGGRIGDAPVTGPPGLRAAASRYRDQLLGRLDASPELGPLSLAFAALPAAAARRAAAVIACRLLGRAGAPVVSLSSALLRQLGEGGPEALAAAAAGADPEPAHALLESQYLALAAGARRCPRLLEPTDTFLAQHIEALGDLGQRVAAEHIAAARADLGAALAGVRPSRPPRVRDRTTRLREEERYPAGGFSAVSTSGSIENLVTSELIYMDEQPGEVDLFDVRYAEGELLYYTRDDSDLVRGRRALRVALLPDLDRARIKDPGARRQRLVTALGLVAAVIDRLEAALEGDALEVRVATVAAPGGEQPLDAERALLEIVFAESIERGVVSVEAAGDLAWLAADAAPGVETATLLVGRAAAPPPDGPGPAAALSLGAPRPRLAWAGEPPPPRREGSIEGAWTAVARALLAGLL